MENPGCDYNAIARFEFSKVFPVKRMKKLTLNNVNNLVKVMSVWLAFSVGVYVGVKVCAFAYKKIFFVLFFVLCHIRMIPQ